MESHFPKIEMSPTEDPALTICMEQSHRVADSHSAGLEISRRLWK
jgi:hypothetical protein